MRFPKLRLQHVKYTTGNSQYWTYEYTEEDYEAMQSAIRKENGSIVDMIIISNIVKYFKKHPCQ